MMKNKTNNFDFVYIKRCAEKEKILVRHNKVGK